MSSVPSLGHGCLQPTVEETEAQRGKSTQPRSCGGRIRTQLSDSKAHILWIGCQAPNPGALVARSRGIVRADCSSFIGWNPGLPPRYVRSSLHQNGACLLHAGLLQVGAGPAELVRVALEVLLLEDDDLQQQLRVRPRQDGEEGQQGSGRGKGTREPHRRLRVPHWGVTHQTSHQTVLAQLVTS